MFTNLDALDTANRKAPLHHEMRGVRTRNEGQNFKRPFSTDATVQTFEGRGKTKLLGGKSALRATVPPCNRLLVFRVQKTLISFTVYQNLKKLIVMQNDSLKAFLEAISITRVFFKVNCKLIVVKIYSYFYSSLKT